LLLLLLIPFMTLVDVWYLRMMKVSLKFDTHVGLLYFSLEH
jgi:hypothetical protein